MLFGNSDQVTRAIEKSISNVCLHTPQRHRSVIIDLCPAGTRCLSLPWFSCLEKLTTLAVVGSRWMSDNESQEDSTDGRPPPLLNGDDSSSSSESGTSCSINHEIVLEKAEELYANGGCELLPRVRVKLANHWSCGLWERYVKASHWSFVVPTLAMPRNELLSRLLTSSVFYLQPSTNIDTDTSTVCSRYSISMMYR
jgi:hypothetical protein